MFSFFFVIVLAREYDWKIDDGWKKMKVTKCIQKLVHGNLCTKMKVQWCY